MAGSMIVRKVGVDGFIAVTLLISRTSSTCAASFTTASTRSSTSLFMHLPDALASPLPAPPDPAVFTHVIRLDFHGEPYSAGASPDQYESEILTSSTR